MTIAAQPLDVMAMGRLGVDIYPLQSGLGLEAVETFGKFLGGSAANVAVAAATLGRRVGLASRVGRDPFGRYLLAELTRLGVDNEAVLVDDVLRTPVTFCEIFPPDDFPLYFYRDPKAPDLNISPEDLDPDAVRDAGILWVTATGLSAEPSRQAHQAALDVQRTGHTVLDLDYRPMFWADESDARAAIGEVLHCVTVAVGNREECRVAVGETDPERAADALLDRGVGLAIVKQGPDGVLAKTREESVVVRPATIQVVNGLGAGDAFGGAVCHGLLEGWRLERLLQFANAAGAIVASRLECSSAMPTVAEVEALVEREGAR